MTGRVEIGPGLDVACVNHAFGPRTVVREASLAVSPGEILCLFGPSGCGKSTLLRVIAGLEPLQEGRIFIEGRKVADPTAHVAPEDRSVTLLFQDFALFPHLSVVDNVTFGLRHLSPDKRLERAREVLRQVGMIDYADRFPHTLSGGEQQRVALARARAPRPRVMLLDEPFSSLDVRLRNRLRDMVLHVLKRTTAATVIVTHDPEEAMFMGDRIAVMLEGRIVQTGTPQELYHEPATPYVAGLFGDLNRMTAEVRNGHVDTALGRIRAPGFDDGTDVYVLSRPESLSIGPPDRGGEWNAVGRVEMSRMLGHTNVVHLSIPDGDGSSVHLHARTMGSHLPSPDDEVGVRLNEDQVFLFPFADPGENADR